MTPAFVAVARDATAQEAIAAIRNLVDQAETVNYVYVVDEERHLLGVLSLYRLLLSRAAAPVVELMAPTTVRVRASADQEVAARLLTDRNLLAIPVVDDDDRLIGIITEDDVADVLQAEATEDIERLGGSQPLNIPYRLSNVPLLVRKRVGWLLVLFIAEAYTGTVLRGFEGELAAVVSLGFFIPLLIGTGGNIGSQTATLIVRAMAIGEVTLRDLGWIVFKELRVGLIMGGVMGVVGFALAALLNVGPEVGLVVALTVHRHLGLVGDRGGHAAPGAAAGRGGSGGGIGAADQHAGGRHRADHLLRDCPAPADPVDEIRRRWDARRS